MNSYIFILCPPYSGSTILWKLVATSKTVSSLPSEGQFLPEVKDIMRKAPWDSSVKLPWEQIKAVWDSYWDYDKAFLLEKSPPNIIHIDEIIRYFKPVYFISMIRNPYAHCESLIRRNKWSAEKAADFSVFCMRQQAENKEKLKSSLFFTYEELIANPAEISQKIQAYIPEIGELEYNKNFAVHSLDGNVERGIIDLNKKKINNLSKYALEKINKILHENQDIMQYWHYEYYKPSFYHDIIFIKTRMTLLINKVFSKINKFFKN